ncbi:MAG: phosphoribosylamine--glycine ligase, partial [Candidatus Omnitrophica bacterium CG11_big_fil_rev_8_21_14_0_20_64_10]
SGPKVLEFNVRFGDPECQAILPRLQSDLVELILACNEGRVAGTPPVWKKELAACVVLASEGYPAKPDIGRAITGIPSPDSEGEALVFHAGTRIEKGRLINSGGRVLNVVGLGETLSAALTQAYGTADRIEYIGKWLRRDIGAKTLGNLEATARRKR